MVVASPDTQKWLEYAAKSQEKIDFLVANSKKFENEVMIIE
jgi:hypothetical protein